MEIIISDPIFVTVVELVISNDGQEVIQKMEYQAHLQFSMDERLSGTSKYVDDRL